MLTVLAVRTRQFRQEFHVEALARNLAALHGLAKKPREIVAQASSGKDGLEESMRTYPVPKLDGDNTEAP